MEQYSTNYHKMSWISHNFTTNESIFYTDGNLGHLYYQIFSLFS